MLGPDRVGIQAVGHCRRERVFWREAVIDGQNRAVAPSCYLRWEPNRLRRGTDRVPATVEVQDRRPVRPRITD